MSWISASIVRRLVVLTVVAGLFTGVVGVAVVDALQRRELRESAAARNLANAERLATLVDSRIDALEAQLELLASRPAVAALTSDAGAELAVALRVSDELDALVLHDRSGRPVAAAASSELLDVRGLPARPDLAGALEGSGPQVSAAGGSGALPTFELAVAVEDPPGTLIGSLVGQAPVALVVQETETRPADDGISAFVTAGDGTVIAHHELERVLDGDRFPVEEVFAEGRRSAAVEEDGETILLTAGQLAVTPGWVVVRQAERDAIGPVRSTTADVTGVFLAVVASIVAAVILAGHRLLRPLGPLAEAVERLGAGDRDVRVDATGGGEVSVLAEGFNRMATALQERQRELEEAERAARRSEERLRLMVEGVEDYAIVLLDLDGRVRSWNTGARRLLGPPADEAVGRPLTSFFDRADPPPDPLVAAAQAGRGEGEGWCRRSDGARFWARIVATGLRDESDRPYGFAVVLHDLTARHAARLAMQAALDREREASEELRRTNELKDEFLAVAAHEIRTPLSAILGASHVLSGDWEELDEEDRIRFRDMIEHHAQDMRLIVERLLDLTRLQAGRVRLVPDTFPLAEELRRHVDLLGRTLAEHVVEIEAPEVEVHSDREALRHIVTNLLSNAAKFSPPGSTVTVRAAVEDERFTVEVVDRGIGIPEDDQELVFELFRQSSNEFSTARGTGVGLAIVRRYVELLGGEVTLSSRPGSGSTFRVAIPRVQPVPNA